MKRIWKLISNLGIEKTRDLTDWRTIILVNQINFAMLCCMIMLLIVIFTGKMLTGDILSFGTLRVFLLLGLNILNIALAGMGYTKLCKLSLIFLPHIIFLLGPTFSGYVEEEGFTYYPYVMIGCAVIPQLLLNPRKEKLLYWSSLAYYFILVLTIDKIMIITGTGQYPIVERINTFYQFYKTAQIALFLFITSSIYYLQWLGIRYEDELKSNNQKLDIQNKELQRQKDEIERKKDELIIKEIETWQKQVSIISHEILNSAVPITNLAGMTRQMLEDESGTILKPVQISEEINNDIHHGLEVIESRTSAMINFVKATKNVMYIPKPVMRDVPVKELFERINILFSPKLKEHGVFLKKQVDPENLIIRCDLELVEQVIINLIQNSIEAMNGSKDRRLTLKAGRNGKDRPQILISDNGPGIAEDVAEKIFLPFFSTKPENSGTGLSTSRQIMMAHNGRLELDRQVKEGASFIMVF